MIFVADDSPVFRKVITSTLELGEYEFHEFVDGADLVRALESKPDKPELILLDVRMPKMDGITACQKIRENLDTEDIPVILISSDSDEETIVQGLDQGADDYVVKPFQPAILLAKVRATLRARRKRQGDAGIVTLSNGAVFNCRYEVKRKLGHGGMGVVYHATDLEEEKEVVLKIQDCRDDSPDQAIQRFRREVDALAGIDHPNVVRILCAGFCRGYHYYTMEYVEGRSLRAILRERTLLPVSEAFELAAQVAEGLQAVHDAGFIHRDVKPENILVDTNGSARIADFGVVFPAEEEATRITRDGKVVGTPAYMAPEQILGGRVGPQADIYGLGLVLFEMLTGKFYRHTESLVALFRNIGLVRVPSAYNSDLPSTVDELCLRIYAHAVEERFDSARELAQALRDLAAQLR